MTGQECLARQLGHHYELVRRGVKGLTCEQTHFQLTSGRPSIAWLLGHLTYCADTVAQSVCGLSSAMTDEFLKAGREPHWGSFSDKVWQERTALWEKASARTLVGVEGLSDAELAEPPAVEVHVDFRDSLTSRAAFLAGHVFHLAYHLGQVGSVRAELGLPWWSG